VEQKTTEARKRVDNAETAIKQEQEDMGSAEKAGMTTTKSDTPFEEMLNSIGYSLSDLATSDDGEDGVDEDDGKEHPEQGKPSKDDSPCWVMGTISEMVQHRMERCRQ